VELKVICPVCSLLPFVIVCEICYHWEILVPPTHFHLFPKDKSNRSLWLTVVFSVVFEMINKLCFYLHVSYKPKDARRFIGVLM